MKQRLGPCARMRDENSVLSTLQLLDTCKYVRLSLWSKAFDSADEPLLTGAFQIINALDTQTLVKRHDLVKS